MLNRRRVVQGGLAAAGSLTVSAPFGARAQGKPPVKVRYNEVVRSILYAPAYVAITKGYFKDAGLDVDDDDRAGRRQVGRGAAVQHRRHRADRAGDGDLRAEQRLADQDADLLRADRHRRLHADGPREGRQVRLEHAARARKSSASVRAARRSCSSKRRCGRTASTRRRTSSSTTTSRSRRASAPGSRARTSSRIFIEPDASQLELDGKAHFLASIGETVGPADYTTFMATDKYINENPEVIQAWTNAIYQGAEMDRSRAGGGGRRRRSSSSSRASTRRRSPPPPSAIAS